MTDPRSYAHAYVGLGWVLVPIPPGTKGPTGQGWNTASRWIDTPEKVDATWTADSPWGMGLIHEPSGTCALDVDDVPEARRVFVDFGLDLDAILAAGVRLIGAEGRAKALFAAPVDLPLAMHKLMWREPGTPNTRAIFELRAGLVQDVLPPSIHPNGHAYAWHDAGPTGPLPALPRDLLSLWRHFPAIKPQLDALSPWAPPAPPPASRPRPVVQGHGDVVGQYNDAYDIENTLRVYGYRQKGRRWLAPQSTSGIPGVTVLKDGRMFSHHASDPMGDGYAHDAFDLFTAYEHAGDVAAAVRAAADDLGIPPRPYDGDFSDDDAPLLDFTALLASATGDAPPSARPGRPAFPARLLAVPGLVGELADWITRTAYKPQPILALGAALAAVATLTGRKVRTATDLRGNLYVLAVAEAGAGKEHARQALRRVFDAAGAFQRVAVEDLASDAGAAAALHACPSSLFLLDEIGRLLKTLGGAHASPHLSNIIGWLLRVESSAAGPFAGKSYADIEKAQVTQQPCLSIYGTTAPDVFNAALTPDQVGDGFLSRLLVFESEDPDPEPQHVVDRAVPGHLVESVLLWEGTSEYTIGDPYARRGNVATLVHPCPRVIPRSSEAHAIWKAFEADMRERRHQLREAGQHPGLYVRAAGTADRLALVVTAGCLAQPDEPAEVSGPTMRWACDLALFLADSLAYRVIAHVAENEQERRTKRVAALIREAGAQGITKNELTRRTQYLDRRQRDDILGTLMLTDDVVRGRGTEPGSKKPTIRFWWHANAPADVALTAESDSSNLTPEPSAATTST